MLCYYIYHILNMFFHLFHPHLKPKMQDYSIVDVHPPLHIYSLVVPLPNSDTKGIIFLVSCSFSLQLLTIKWLGRRTTQDICCQAPCPRRSAKQFRFSSESPSLKIVKSSVVGFPGSNPRYLVTNQLARDSMKIPYSHLNTGNQKTLW